MGGTCATSDSRSTAGIGFVPRERLVGRAMLVLWPLDNFEVFSRPDYTQLSSSEAWFTPGLATATR